MMQSVVSLLPPAGWLAVGALSVAVLGLVAYASKPRG